MAQECFKKPGDRKGGNQVVERCNGQVDRTEGGGGHGYADFEAKRSRGASGYHKATGAKNKALENLEDCMKSLMITQMRESPMIVVEEGIMTLLQKCLASSSKGGSFVVVEGNLEHYESKKEVDVGWGCGWRNLEMLASYLISEDPEVREVLFGGAGYVPDIPALQQWLEIAWAKGFDVPGGEYFDWKIKGTNKWIGTTEGAALLRSFGVRARIVDFQATGGKREPPSELRSKTGTEEGHSRQQIEDKDKESVNKESEKGSPSDRDGSEASEPRRTAADNGTLDQACIVCGEHKLHDPEFRRDAQDSDMCPHCMKRLQDSGNTAKENLSNAKETQITGRHRHGWDNKTGGDGHEMGQITVKHQQLVEWVWTYFMTENVESRLSKSLHLSQRSPLYFQHRGHSQTVVGIERRKVSTSPDSEEVNLLVLDPSEKSFDIVESLRKDRGWEGLVKRGLQTLKQTEYQLCYCDRGVAKGEELENLKILTSKSYTY
ncbi:hypothetical protein KC19_VG091400 [Ceratodon purpureus]|uniref:UFSP1/2/DUB catalytic domain-containing protein n=2 Tax=Ceratodon purpureus TaxID=3225 RepID=A0A8T0HNL9_CERPU|nr:hypothetical protein KC19_VG091400 [Ceratodon purpureus]KAG0572396.1 hypothetical protein KC19_VG091400 [Ceratodon purpureus]KAG0572397.1 hypothetical protein KC19_VG091400 [Ceratodon purpureus]